MQVGEYLARASDIVLEALEQHRELKPYSCIWFFL